MFPSAERADLLDDADPVRAFRAAAATGSPIGLRTSGTTGRPRIVLRTTDSWSVSFDVVSELTGIDTSSRVWVPGPIQSTMNLFARVHADSMGAQIVDDPADATHAHLTPLALERSLDHQSLRPGTTVIVAGDALRPATRERAARAGLLVHHYYGASELSFVAWARPAEPLTLFPRVECRIVDGETWVRSPYLSLGYTVDSAGGPFVVTDDGFATVGDLGYLEGKVLTVRGRGDAAITTGGATVLVADVESVLREGASGDVLVVGMPHPSLGQIVVGIVTVEDDVPVLTDLARQCLTPVQRPRRWHAMPRLPMTAAGKPDRARLVRMLDDAPGA